MNEYAATANNGYSSSAIPPSLKVQESNNNNNNNKTPDILPKKLQFVSTSATPTRLNHQDMGSQ